MGKSKAIHVAISGVLAAALVFSGCGKKEKPVVEEKTLSVDLQTAKKGELVLAETYVGTASAQEEVTVYPTASGEVLQVNVSLGDHVTAGQQLFKIDDESARLSLKSAQAGYASQQAQMNQTLGGQMELNQQQEQQGIAGNERSADSSSRALEEAEENIERGQRAIEDAQKDVEDARDKYDEAVEKYHSAKSYLDDWEDLKEEESAFSSASAFPDLILSSTSEAASSLRSPSFSSGTG